jgi:hypothetical protein
LRKITGVRNPFQNTQTDFRFWNDVVDELMTGEDDDNDVVLVTNGEGDELSSSDGRR